MSNLHDTYQSVAERSMKTTDKMVTFVKDFMPFLLLALNLIVVVITKLFRTHLENPFTVDFFISLATNIFTTMFCYTVFIRYGERSEKAISSSYLDNLGTWGELSGVVRHKYSDRFTAYCFEQIELERREIRYSYLLNHTMITVERYKREFEGLSAEKLDLLVKQGVITRSEAKWIKKANIIPKVRPIKPMLILCGVQASHLNDVGREAMSHTTAAILAKPIILFSLTVVITMIKGTWAGITSAAVVFEIVYSIFSIILSSIVGYSSGAAAAEKDMDRIKGRIFFLERFISNESRMAAEHNQTQSKGESSEVSL